MKKHVHLLFLLLVFLTVFHSMGLYAQQDAPKEKVPDGELLISKAYVDSSNKEVWIEVYNPENIPLRLTSMRISGIRSLNVLPGEFKGQQYIEIKSKESFIICSDIKLFRLKYGNQLRAVGQPLLKNMIDGGFVAINNQTVSGSTKTLVRIGKPEMSESVGRKIPDSLPVEVTADGTCYVREITADGRLSSWKKNTPNPGKN